MTESDMEQLSHFKPYASTIDLARRIRMLFGHGGANFPGARELYQAADKIEAWAAVARTEPKP